MDITTNINNLSSAQLRRAAELSEQIEQLQQELEKVLLTEGKSSAQALKSTTTTHIGRPKGWRMSAEARAKIAAAQRARWARVRRG